MVEYLAQALRLPGADLTVICIHSCTEEQDSVQASAYHWQPVEQEPAQ